MKYAVISDIHGNIEALNAVLKDASEQLIDYYIFLGDYIAGLPYSNEVVETIRSIKNTYLIHGNGEPRLKYLDDENSSLWSLQQFAPMCWDYKTITDENKDFLFSLPSKKEILTNGSTIYLTHIPSDFFGKTKVDELSGHNHAMYMPETNFTRNGYLIHASNILKEDSMLKATLDGLHDGVYLFGHFHTQWYHYFSNKLLVNPGSCGLPFDSDTRSPYTIITFCNDQWVVEERRVIYDIERVIFELRNSFWYRQVNIWGKITEKAVITAKNQNFPYLNFVEKIAIETGDLNRPYSDVTWDLAASTYKW